MIKVYLHFLGFKMSYIGIAFHNVQRNRWRSILLILGITLSVALETGIAISIDSLYANFITDHRLNNYTDINIHSILDNKTTKACRSSWNAAWKLLSPSTGCSCCQAGWKYEGTSNLRFLAKAQQPTCH